MQQYNLIQAVKCQGVVFIVFIVCSAITVTLYKKKQQEKSGEICLGVSPWFGVFLGYQFTSQPSKTLFRIPS